MKNPGEPTKSKSQCEYQEETIAFGIRKCGVFAAAVVAYGAVCVFLLDTSLPPWSWAVPLIAVALCGVFFVYDWGLTRLIGGYLTRIRPKMQQLFRF